MIYQGSANYPVDEIIIHCSATRPEWMQDSSIVDKRDEIDRWHKQRGWKGIGYHIVIDRDGTYAFGRKYEDIGAHVSGKNKGTIGICLIGGHGSNENDKFEEHFTEAQRKRLKAFIDEIAQRTKIVKVSGHNEYAAKACPGFRVSKEFPWPRPTPIKTRIKPWWAKLLTAIFGGLK